MRAATAKLGLILAVAGVLLGLLGMHVLNGHHAGHSPGGSPLVTASMEVAAHADHAGEAHASHGGVDSGAAAAVDSSTPGESCGCAAPCAEATEVHSPCVPLPNTQTLTALPGPQLLVPADLPAVRLIAGGGVVAHPPRPSLYELCISRC
ncbi:hypothetical protein BIU82_05915 [Arthrobacter sp. SW1]|uniref:hypothetical protein n=1 Tax=Arthrobacter sp. SW1 TaxID=1920889 RepID=UPI000877D569|nr:hypothetical protein [Arthrobacter sp. SW1]OFI38038.1 hypothetical protein BIU82_05915 [Arthrobacter sp. SW1]